MYISFVDQLHKWQHVTKTLFVSLDLNPSSVEKPLKSVNERVCHIDWLKSMCKQINTTELMTQLTLIFKIKADITVQYIIKQISVSFNCGVFNLKSGISL